MYDTHALVLEAGRSTPRWNVLAAACLAGALAACGGGGGGGSGDSTPQRRGPVTLSGTVAVGVPLAGVTVDVAHNIGALTSTRTDAEGRYSVTLPAGNLPPYMITAYNFDAGADPVLTTSEGRYPRIYSVATNAGTVNVTPLTSLTVVRLLGRKPLYFGDWTFLRDLPEITDQRIAAAQSQVAAYLSTRPSNTDGNVTAPFNLTGVANFISTPFRAVPGDPYDDTLERLAASLTPGETMRGMEEHLLHAGDPAANLVGLLSLEFDADCFGPPDQNPIMPRGRQHVSLNTSGITAGSYHYSFAAGDRIGLVTENSSGENRWTFFLRDIGTPGFPVWVDSAWVNLARGGIESVSVGAQGLGAANCVAIGKLGLADRHPSILSQVRLLASSVTDPSFTCSGLPAFPGVPNGSNVLLFDANGAVRVNDHASGHVVHMPSLRISMYADLVPGGGGVTTKLRSLYASRRISDLDEDLAIRLGTDGHIEGVRFAIRQQNGSISILSKTCGLSP